MTAEYMSPPSGILGERMVQRIPGSWRVIGCLMRVSELGGDAMLGAGANGGLGSADAGLNPERV